MGQYFKPVLLIENGGETRAECYWPWDADNGAKITEHSWVGNNFVNAVMSRIGELTGKGATVHLAWVGDYSDVCDGHEHENLHREAYAAAWGEYIDVHSPFSPRRVCDLYIHDMDRDEYVTVPGKSDEGEWILHPVPLLTAIGNGQGGGDYDGCRMDLVGTWAYDEIRVLTEAPKGAEEIKPGFREAE